MECIACFIISPSGCTVSKGGKSVAWFLGMGCVLPNLAFSEALSIKLGMDAFHKFTGVVGYAGRDWFDSTTSESF